MITISQLAAYAGVTVRAVRHYHQVGLLPEPARDRSGYRSYGAADVVRLLELTALRRIAAVKSKLQRTNPVEEAETYNRMFGELAALEAHRRALRDRIVGSE